MPGYLDEVNTILDMFEDNSESINNIDNVDLGTPSDEQGIEDFYGQEKDASIMGTVDKVLFKKPKTESIDTTETIENGKKIKIVTSTKESIGPKELRTSTKALGAAAVIGTGLFLSKLLKDKKGKVTDETDEYMKDKDFKSLKRRFASHFTDYMSGGAASDLGKAAVGVGALSAFTMMTSARKGISKGLTNLKMIPMIRRLKESEELEGLDFQDIKVKNLIKTIYNDYPNLSKNYYVMHDVMKQYQEFGIRGVGAAFFKQLAELESRLGDGPSARDTFQALPEGKSKKLKSEDANTKLPEMVINTGLNMLSKSASITNPLFIPAKDYYANMLKMAYEIDRVNEAINSYNTDPIFKKIADGTSNDFIKEARETIEDTKKSYGEKIAMCKDAIEKIAVTAPTSGDYMRGAFGQSNASLGKRLGRVGKAFTTEASKGLKNLGSAAVNNPGKTLLGMYAAKKAWNVARDVPKMYKKVKEGVDDAQSFMKAPLSTMMFGRQPN